jgi:hypothetical protein
MIDAVLKGVPDVEPFHFAGYPDNAVYIHSTCGTVVDVVRASDTEACVQEGECDCETPAPWFMVYVAKQEKV